MTLLLNFKWNRYGTLWVDLRYLRLIPVCFYKRTVRYTSANAEQGREVHAVSDCCWDQENFRHDFMRFIFEAVASRESRKTSRESVVQIVSMRIMSSWWHVIRETLHPGLLMQQWSSSSWSLLWKGTRTLLTVLLFCVGCCLSAGSRHL